MPKPPNKRGAETNSTIGGIVGAITQDVELTVEQAEEAANKTAHAAAVAVGIASSGAPDAVKPSKDRWGTAKSKRATPLRSSSRKPKK